MTHFSFAYKDISSYAFNQKDQYISKNASCNLQIQANQSIASIIQIQNSDKDKDTASRFSSQNSSKAHFFIYSGILEKTGSIQTQIGDVFSITLIKLSAKCINIKLKDI